MTTAEAKEAFFDECPVLLSSPSHWWTKLLYTKISALIHRKDKDGGIVLQVELLDRGGWSVTKASPQNVERASAEDIANHDRNTLPSQQLDLFAQAGTITAPQTSSTPPTPDTRSNMPHGALSTAPPGQAPGALSAAPTGQAPGEISVPTGQAPSAIPAPTGQAPGAIPAPHGMANAVHDIVNNLASGEAAAPQNGQAQSSEWQKVQSRFKCVCCRSMPPLENGRHCAFCRATLEELSHKLIAEADQEADSARKGSLLINTAHPIMREWYDAWMLVHGVAPSVPPTGIERIMSELEMITPTNYIDLDIAATRVFKKREAAPANHKQTPQKREKTREKTV